MHVITENREQVKRPEKILQFGEGNFLRAFVDWMVDITNEKTEFNGNVVLIQPRGGGPGDKINEQKGFYTTVLRGMQDGKQVENLRLITSVSRCLNPYSQYEEYMKCAENPDLRFVVSNTTEAGIAYCAGDKLDDRPQNSFPGKIAAFLQHRFSHFNGDASKGLIFIPCELIDKNGNRLKEIVLRYAEEWNLDASFIAWINISCDFCNSLVDRIVSGYPGEEADALCAKAGYTDTLLDAAELFYLWVIETKKDHSKELPFIEAGLNVIWTDDLSFYRTRKVRILNGAHTMIVAIGFLCGLDTVQECIHDTQLFAFMKKGLFDEIIPSMDGSAEELNKYAAEVLERFGNPYIRHLLLSITLNSISKFKTRDLPSFISYIEKYGKVPTALAFSLAALIAFYEGKDLKDGCLTGTRNGSAYRINDDISVLERFAQLYAQSRNTKEKAALLAHEVLSESSWWGEDLTRYRGLEASVRDSLESIWTNGMKVALESVFIQGNIELLKDDLTQIHPDDNVAVAIRTISDNIPAGHKVALCAIECGEKIIKYGYPIGKATQAILKFEHIHTHNMKTLLSETPEYYYDEKSALEYARQEHIQAPVIQAYKRSDGKIGIRNEIWIVPTVGCVNKTAEALARWADEQYPGGVYAWTHPYGCSQMGADHAATREILADLVRHPNAGGVLVVGLGCENNTVEEFQKLLGDYDKNRVKFLVTQKVEDEISEGKKLLLELAEFASRFEREDVSSSKLIIGMKCGGSDGLSGITSNPLVGRACDRITSMGGSAILTEVPEMFGAEQILMDRCESRDLFRQTVELVNGFKKYYTAHDQVIYENPSPGNKEGGITTLEDKSLGCVQKGGKAPVRGVLRYGQRVQGPGLHLLEGPGNDIVSTTAITAAGAHLILFTTGRGTPLGAPIPTIKISSNTALAQKKPNWIDFDAGRLLAENGDTLLDELMNMIFETASGKMTTRNEKNGYREIAIFKDGVTL